MNIFRLLCALGMIALLASCGKKSEPAEADTVSAPDPYLNYLNRDKYPNKQPSPPPTEPAKLDPAHDLEVELTDGYPALMGYVKNKSKNTYKYVEIEYDFLTKNDAVMGNGSDNVHNLKAGEKWSFKIPVPTDDSRYAHARFSKVTGR